MLVHITVMASGLASATSRIIVSISAIEKVGEVEIYCFVQVPFRNAVQPGSGVVLYDHVLNFSYIRADKAEGSCLNHREQFVDGQNRQSFLDSGLVLNGSAHVTIFVKVQPAS
jgi:hypothetical protein